MSTNQRITITVEGPTGSGKSGISQLIMHTLAAHSLKVAYADTVDGPDSRLYTLREIGRILNSIHGQGTEIKIIEKQGPIRNSIED